MRQRIRRPTHTEFNGPGHYETCALERDSSIQKPLYVESVFMFQLCKPGRILFVFVQKISLSKRGLESKNRKFLPNGSAVT